MLDLKQVEAVFTIIWPQQDWNGGDEGFCRAVAEKVVRTLQAAGPEPVAWRTAPDILLDQIAAIRDEYLKLRSDCLDQMEWHASQGDSEETGDFSTEAERHGAALLACNRILKLSEDFKEPPPAPIQVGDTISFTDRGVVIESRSALVATPPDERVVETLTPDIYSQAWRDQMDKLITDDMVILALDAVDPDWNDEFSKAKARSNSRNWMRKVLRMLREEYLNASKDAMELAGKLEAAEADKARLSEALRPFAKVADAYDGLPPPKYFGDTNFEWRYPDSTKVSVKVGELRAARAALSGSGSGWLADLRAKWPIGTQFRIEHDGFVGTVRGYYERDDGYRGIVGQIDPKTGAKIVHVYGEKWPLPAAPQRGSE